MVGNFLDGERSDRAQLLLVGSLAIAVVVIGLAVVVNSVLLTENVARSESVGVADEATGFDAESVRNVREIVLRVNHRSRLRTQGEVKSQINASIRNYSHLLAQTTVRDRGAWIQIEYNDGKSTWGERIVQADDGEFRPPSSPRTNWRPLVNDPSVSDDNADIGRFVLNLNISESEDSFVVKITNSSGEHARINVEKISNESVRVKTSRSYVSSASPSEPSRAECSPTQDRLLIELKTGAAFNADCSFAGFANTSDPSRTLDPPYGVELENGGNAVGKFSFVTNRSVDYDDDLSLPDNDGYGNCNANPDGDDPCAAPAVWTANATITYQSDRINYRRDHNVSVYP